MRIKSLFVITTLALTACSGGHSSSDGGNTPAQAERAGKSVKSSASQAGAGIDQVLAALNKSLKLSTGYDRVVEKSEGFQRQVFLEVLGASDRDAQKEVSKAFTASGFKVHQGKDDQNGIRMSFKKSGVNEIHALIRAKGVGPALKNSDATSSIYLKQTSTQ